MGMEYISVVGSTVFELLCSVFILSGLLKKERAVSKWVSTIYVVITTLYIMFVPNEWTSGSYVLLFLYAKFGYKNTGKDSIVSTILCLVLVGVAEMICLFPIVFLFQGRWPDTVNNLLGSGCSMILCMVLYQTVPIWRLKRWCNRKEVLYIAVVIFSLILMLTTIMDYHMTLELELGDYVYIIACVLLLWVLGLQLMKYRYEERIRKKYFEAFKSVMDQMKRRQHKFRNQMDTIYSLHQLYEDYDTLVQEQRNYLGKLVDYEMPTDVLILENPILIAHVYEKITEAQELGLRIQMRLSCSLANCMIEDIHMVEIIGTLLDNAIQDMLETGKKRYLFLEVKEENGPVIRVGNPHEKVSIGEIKKMFENGYSTKGEGRGIGLYHVRKLVKRYKIELMVENQMIDGKNYICFSVIMGKSTPLT